MFHFQFYLFIFVWETTVFSDGFKEQLLFICGSVVVACFMQWGMSVVEIYVLGFRVYMFFSQVGYLWEKVCVIYRQYGGSGENTVPYHTLMCISKVILFSQKQQKTWRSLWSSHCLIILISLLSLHHQATFCTLSSWLQIHHCLSFCILILAAEHG